MQYFTFLGLGPLDRGYREVIYSFEDLKNVTISRFVQEPIIERFEHELSECYIFITKESKERYEDNIMQNIGKRAKIEFILIDMNIQFDDFVEQLLDKIKENERIIIDVTHSFRNIPMKLLFALKYIEMSKNAHVEHLYYGKLLPENKHGKIEKAILIDFIHDYHMTNVSSVLHQFEKTLTISSEEIEELIQSDHRMKQFLQYLFQFNQMIEFCEFDRCISVVNKIIESCRGIEKHQEQYTIIIPLVKKIQGKFNAFESTKTPVRKKSELIKILLAHNKYQQAITFTDQFFREELVRVTLEPRNLNFNLNSYLVKNKCGLKQKDCYALSQYLIIERYVLRNVKVWKNKNFELEGFFDKFKENIHIASRILAKYKTFIDEFYTNIRNHINHGTTIQKKESIKNNIFQLLECINAFGG